jgi:hypothetical protein
MLAVMCAPSTPDIAESSPGDRDAKAAKDAADLERAEDANRAPKQAFETAEASEAAQKIQAEFAAVSSALNSGEMLPVEALTAFARTIDVTPHASVPSATFASGTSLSPRFKYGCMYIAELIWFVIVCTELFPTLPRSPCRARLVKFAVQESDASADLHDRS